MAKVHNWQIGREMSYPYPQAFPRAQIRLRLQHQPLHRLPELHDGLQVHLDLLKGQENMWWNNVETKPYGGYPQHWDVKILDLLEKANPGGQTGTATPDDRKALYGEFDGKTIFEAAQNNVSPEGAQKCLGLSAHRRRMVRAQPSRRQPAGQEACAKGILQRAAKPAATQDLVLLPGAHLQSLHLSGVPGRLPAQRDLQAARRRHRADRSGTLPRLSQVRRSLPVQEEQCTAAPPATSEKCVGCFRGSKVTIQRAVASRCKPAAWPPASARSACKDWSR